MKQALFVFLAVNGLIMTNQQPVTLFAHGIVDNQKQADPYAKLVNGPMHSFNFPDANTWFRYLFYFWRTDLGQKHDIAALAKADAQVQQQYPAQPRIIMGLSRGAATAFNYMAIHKPANVAGLILISPYASIEDALNAKFTSTIMRFIAKTIMKAFLLYDCNGIHPITVAHDMPKDLPIMILCSQEDTTVPASSSLKLADLLKETGHTQVQVVCTDKGKHGKFLDGADADTVKKAITGFYSRYSQKKQTILASDQTVL